MSSQTQSLWHPGHGLVLISPPPTHNTVFPEVLQIQDPQPLLKDPPEQQVGAVMCANETSKSQMPQPDSKLK